MPIIFTNKLVNPSWKVANLMVPPVFPGLPQIILWNMNDGAVATLDLDYSDTPPTLGIPQNIQPGATYLLKIVQGGTGNKELLWDIVFKWPSGVAPVLSTDPGAVDLFSFFSPDGFVLYGSYLRGLA